MQGDTEHGGRSFGIYVELFFGFKVQMVYITN